jgi:outer membrane protein assembly factor BamB
LFNYTAADMKTSIRISRLLPACAGALALLLAGCNDKAVDPPAKLVDIKPTLKIKKLWSEGLSGDTHLRLGLQPAVVHGVVYAASRNGEVLALTEDKGKRLWRTKTRLELGGGPAVGEGSVALGSVNGELVVLDGSTGNQRWLKQLSGEIIAKPVIGSGIVVVRTVDGRLQAFDLKDGTPRWNNEESVPKLTLRGTAAPIMVNGVVICGFDNGKLLAVDATTGDQMWNVTIDSPAGRTELDKLADIDSVAAVSGKDVFVAGYQGRVAMLALDNGQIWWAKDASSYRGFGLDDDTLYLTRSNGVISALHRTDGNSKWDNETLRQRGLTAAIPVGNSVVVADYEGYVHWLSKADGSVQARAKTDGDRVTNAPVVADGRVFVQTDGGKLVAFEATPKS